jgi:hypothetical protein
MSTSTLSERMPLKSGPALRREIGRTVNPSKPCLPGEVQSPEDLLLILVHV